MSFTYTRTITLKKLAFVAALFSLGCLAFVSADDAQADSASGLISIREEGLASWYGSEFAGRPTSSGEIFDPRKFTAAHRTFPFGTLVTVTNLQNGRRIQVRINDRGPFVEGRFIDLSQAAAEALEMQGQGVAKVRIEAEIPASAQVTYRVEKPAASNSEIKTAETPVLNEVPDSLRIIQIASYANRDAALNLIKFFYDNGLEASEELSPSGTYRVIIANVPLSRLASYQKELSLLGYPQVLVRVQAQAQAQK